MKTTSRVQASASPHRNGWGKCPLAILCRSACIAEIETPSGEASTGHTGWHRYAGNQCLPVDGVTVNYTGIAVTPLSLKNLTGADQEIIWVQLFLGNG